MKTFELPVSKCGQFVGGEIDDNTVAQHRDAENTLPKYGIIIWYEDLEHAKAALQAVMDAHWPQVNEDSK